MTQSIITVENLSKCYRIGLKERGYRTFREAIMDGVKAPMRNFRRLRSLTKFDENLDKSKSSDPLPNASRSSSSSEDDLIWALRDVSFEVKRGDVLGIIGRNGAGKSTLLKILSRITDPTSGEVKLYGRVSSLLEVGTGFHPELTGRENIFLNGAVLGMKKGEIEDKFDEIVSFAEIEKFIDTPVKRYSSGMYVRLAFAVAAHLEPEALLVDEVLSVGDEGFQKKCISKMESVGHEGRTILFVSHNMGAVEQLCTSAVFLEEGKIKRMGTDVQAVIRDYLKVSLDDGNSSEWVNKSGEEFRNDYFTPLEVYVSDEHGGKLPMPMRNDSDMWLTILGETHKLNDAIYISYGIYTETGVYLYGSARTDLPSTRWPPLRIGRNVLRAKIPKSFLNEGIYRIELYFGLMNGEWYSFPGTKAPGVSLEIKGGLSNSPHWTMRRPGLLAPVLEWVACG